MSGKVVRDAKPGSSAEVDPAPAKPLPKGTISLAAFLAPRPTHSSTTPAPAVPPSVPRSAVPAAASPAVPSVSPAAAAAAPAAPPANRAMLRSSRLRQDLCDVCMRIKNMLGVIEDQIAHDTRLNDSQKEQLRQRVEELKEEQKGHDKASETQRRAMNDHVKEHCDKWADELPPVAWPPILHEMPDVGDKGPTEKEQQKNDHDEKGKKLRSRRVLVCCQDYGQSVTIPTYKTARPSVDHWTSNLLGHIFIHADLTRNRNFVYGYDERVAGKGADALATLRWLHWSSELTELLRMDVALPDEIIVICDNC
eukprot:gene24186-11713_t